MRFFFKFPDSMRCKFSGSRDVYKVLKNYWDEHKIKFVEQFNILLLNRTNKIIGIYEVSSGTGDRHSCRPQSISVAAWKANACAMILAQAVPSRNQDFNQSHIKLLKNMVNVGKFSISWCSVISS
jgi:DNA repair protein RadC